MRLSCLFSAFIFLFLPTAVLAQAQTFAVRVIECVADENIKRLSGAEKERLKDHIACGQNKALVVLATSYDLEPGQTKRARNMKSVPFSGHEPNIRHTTAGFKAAPKHFVSNKEAGTELLFQYVEQTEDSAEVSAEATLTEWRSRERVAWFNEDKIYINTEPARVERKLIATGRVESGAPMVLAGDVWFDAPATEDTLKRLPEQARLWIEVLMNP